ncbi:hypothetical protein D3C71_1758120 [compost metagenome]
MIVGLIYAVQEQARHHCLAVQQEQTFHALEERFGVFGRHVIGVQRDLQAEAHVGFVGH